MAKRPVFIPQSSGTALVRTHYAEFQWHPGMSVSQKQKSIESLHRAALELPSIKKTLEISSKSPDALGVALSAFNLRIQTPKGRQFSVECAYQASKVFENGGPYMDLLNGTSREAKKDERLTKSGHLVRFSFFGTEWDLEPRTAFYDWLYINALKKQTALVAQLANYDAFTDIEFNPDRSLNCQAYAAALLLSLKMRGILDEVTSSKEAFLRLISATPINNAHQNELVQPTLGF